MLLDTLRADHLGCYGYERNTSPRIDALAAEGVLFEECLAQSTWTKPATASVLTGHYPARHGATNFESAVDARLPMLAERLAAAGRRTAAFVANGWVRMERSGFRRGFDTFVPLRDDDRSHTRANAVVDAALAWLEEHHDEPFFAYLHAVDPHEPYDPPAPYDQLFDAGYEGDVDGSIRGVDLDALSRRDVEHLVALYDGEIAHADHHVGRLLDALDRLGVADDTAVFFLSDHGEAFGEHGRWRHNPTMQREVVHVPLLLRSPNLPPELRGTRCPNLVQQVDLVPTVLELAGLPPDPALPGRSLLERTVRGAPRAFSEVDFRGTDRKAVVADGWKYVRQWAPTAAEELYRTDRDPGEHEDLAPDGVPPALRAALDRLRAESAEGYTVTVRNGGDEPLHATVVLRTAPAPLASLDLLWTEARHHRDGDGPITHAPPAADPATEHTVAVPLVVAPDDTDALVLVPAPDTPAVSVVVLVADEPADPALALLGTTSIAATAWPVELSPATDVPSSEPFPFPFDEDLRGAPYRIRVWRNPTAASERLDIAPDERAELEALGYGG